MDSLPNDFFISSFQFTPQIFQDQVGLDFVITDVSFLETNGEIPNSTLPLILTVSNYRWQVKSLSLLEQAGESAQRSVNLAGIFQC